MRHTELPWALDGPYVFRQDKLGTVIAECGPDYRPMEERRANAEFIVKACNSHEALTSALQLALAALEDAEGTINHAPHCPYRVSGPCECLRGEVVAVISAAGEVLVNLEAEVQR